MIDFNQCPCIYWSDVTKISYLQRRVIVHSIIYYEMNRSLITDAEFDELAMQLVEMQMSVDDAVFFDSTYYYAMHDFDGTTGYHIASRLTKYDKAYLRNIANNVVMQYEKEHFND